MRYLALDIGNVLCVSTPDPFVEAISETFDVSIEEAQSFLKGFQQLHDLGCTSMEKELRAYFGVKSQVTIGKIAEKWNDMVVPSLGAIHTVNMLIDNCETKVALVSNIGIEHAAQTEIKLKPIIGKVVKHFSCFVGARKPTALYYQSFLLQHPEFTGCLYVDDLKENLEASKPFGFQTLHFDLSVPGTNPGIIARTLLSMPEK